MTHINKNDLITQINQYLTNELSTLLVAANNAHLAAIDDQSVAETQYDTLAIEAGYLAEGQSRRVIELKHSLQKISTFELHYFDKNTPINTGALIQLAQDQKKRQWFFIAPAGAGFRMKMINEQDNNIYHVTVITPSSPMGKALIGNYQYDDIALTIGNNTINDTIALVY